MAGSTTHDRHPIPIRGAREPRARVLLIDDDPELPAVLQAWLEPQGYVVRHAPDGHTALELAETLRPDLILLDLKLPDIDGLVLCGDLKQRSDAPIIICSATERQREGVLGLRLGADDFIAKPLDLYDLEARIAALLRRRRAPHEPAVAAEVESYHVGALVIDRHRRQITLGGEEVRLSPSEYRLLSALAAHLDTVLSREALAQQVWGYQDVAAGRAIDVHIRRLRVKLQEAATAAPPIITVRGAGYQLSTPLHLA